MHFRIQFIKHSNNYKNWFTSHKKTLLFKLKSKLKSLWSAFLLFPLIYSQGSRTNISIRGLESQPVARILIEVLWDYMFRNTSNFKGSLIYMKTHTSVVIHEQKKYTREQIAWKGVFRCKLLQHVRVITPKRRIFEHLE